jgi:hypothetical protein
MPPLIHHDHTSRICSGVKPLGNAGGQRFPFGLPCAGD